MSTSGSPITRARAWWSRAISGLAMLAVLGALCGPSPARAEDDLKGIARDLANQIASTKRVKELGNVTIVITPFDKSSKVADDTADTFQDKLIAAFDNTDQFTIIERKQLEKAISELKLAHDGLTDADHQKELGHFLNAAYMVVGHLFVKNARICADARLVDIEKSDILATASYDPGENKGPDLPRRKRVAIIDFTVPASAINVRGGGAGISRSVNRGIVDMLSQALFDANNFEIVERAQLTRVLREQNLNEQGLLDPATAATAGKILGVDYLIGGSVAQFNYDVQVISTKGLFSGLPDITMTTQTAAVKFDVRLIDTQSAEVVLAVTGDGAVSKKSGSLRQNTEQFTAVDTAWTRGMLGDATRQAIEKVVAPMKDKFPLIGSVVAFTDNNVYLSLGSRQNIKVGNTFEIVRLVKNTAGFSKRLVVGCARVTDLNDDQSQCCFIPAKDTPGLPQTGDTAVYVEIAKDAKRR